MKAARRPTAQAELQKKAATESREAAKNVAYWSIASEIAPDGLLEALSDAQAEATQTLAISKISVDAVIAALQSAADLLTEASNPWADSAASQAALATLGQQMRDIVVATTFEGLNLLDGRHDASPLRFVSGFDATTTPGSFKTMQFQTTAVYRNGFGLLVREGVDITDIRLDSTESAVAALRIVRAALDEVSQYASRIKMAQDRFVIESSAESAEAEGGSRNDSDENAARLQAVETQRQLGSERLPIVNQNSQLSHALPKKAQTGAAPRAVKP
jgi:flagellin